MRCYDEYMMCHALYKLILNNIRQINAFAAKSNVIFIKKQFSKSQSVSLHLTIFTTGHGRLMEHYCRCLHTLSGAHV